MLTRLPPPIQTLGLHKLASIFFHAICYFAIFREFVLSCFHFSYSQLARKHEKSACAHLYNFTLKISKGKIGGSQLSLHIPDAGYELQGVCPLYLYGGEGHVNTGTHQPGIVT